MARVGFYAVESGKISFRRDGNWYNDEERIDNPRIALLFSKSIRQAANGDYYLQVAEERAAITVEDTPYVVRAVDDDGNGGFIVTTNDDQREPLDASSLEVGRDNVLYCRVKDGRFRARFLRTAYYHLSGHFLVDSGETFSIVVRDRRYPIKVTSAEADIAGVGG